MDIYVEKKLNFGKIWPVFLLIIILVAAFFVIKYFAKNQEIEPSTTILATPNIDYSFLTSPAFEALESFPDYPSFQEDEGTSITPGRVNPFAPLK